MSTPDDSTIIPSDDATPVWRRTRHSLFADLVFPDVEDKSTVITKALEKLTLSVLVSDCAETIPMDTTIADCFTLSDDASLPSIDSTTLQAIKDVCPNSAPNLFWDSTLAALDDFTNDLCSGKPYSLCIDSTGGRGCRKLSTTLYETHLEGITDAPKLNTLQKWLHNRPHPPTGISLVRVGGTTCVINGKGEFRGPLAAADKLIELVFGTAMELYHRQDSKPTPEEALEQFPFALSKTAKNSILQAFQCARAAASATSACSVHIAEHGTGLMGNASNSGLMGNASNSGLTGNSISGNSGVVGSNVFIVIPSRPRRRSRTVASSTAAADPMKPTVTLPTDQVDPTGRFGVAWTKEIKETTHSSGPFRMYAWGETNQKWYDYPVAHAVVGEQGEYKAEIFICQGKQERAVLVFHACKYRVRVGPETREAMFHLDKENNNFKFKIDRLGNLDISGVNIWPKKGDWGTLKLQGAGEEIKRLEDAIKAALTAEDTRPTYDDLPPPFTP